MPTWNEANLAGLGRVKESKIKWSKVTPTNNREGNYWLEYRAEGYPTITNYQSSANGSTRGWCKDREKYQVSAPWIDDHRWPYFTRQFSSLRDAKDFAERFPKPVEGKEPVKWEKSHYGIKYTVNGETYDGYGPDYYYADGYPRIKDIRYSGISSKQNTNARFQVDGTSAAFKNFADAREYAETHPVRK